MEDLFVEIQNAARVIATPNYATWISAVAALGAVIVAVIVAVKQNKISVKQNEIAKKQADISERQNRIALFEKRYEVYCELLKICNLSDQMNHVEGHQRTLLLREIEAIYEIEITNKNSINAQLSVAITRIKKSEYILHQSVFLFSNIDSENIQQLIDSLLNCMIFIIKKTNIPVSVNVPEVKSFIDRCNEFFMKYSITLEKELSLK